MTRTKDVSTPDVGGQDLRPFAASPPSGSIAAPAALSNFVPRLSLKGQTLPLMAAVAAAVLVGYNIAAGRWLFVLAMALGTCVLLAPVPVALGGFALLVPFDYVLAIGHPGSRTVTWFVGGAAAVVLLFTGLAGRRLKAPPASACWWLLFGFWALVSAVWSLDRQLALQSFPSLFALLTLYAIAVSLRVNNKEIRWVALLSISGAVVASLLTTYQFYQGHFYAERTMRGSLIVGDTQVNPNTFAIGLLLPLALAAGAFTSARGRLQRMVMLAASAALSMSVFVTMSRGGVLAVMVTLLVCLYRCRKIWRRLTPLLAVFLFPILLMPGAFFKRLGEAAETGGAGRLDIWTASWGAWKQYPAFGAGFANFPTAYTQFAGNAPKFEGFGRDAHNIFILVAVELGLVGLSLLLAAVYSAFRAASKAHRSLAAPSSLLVGCEGACWAILVCSFFDNTLYDKGFWLSFALLAIVTRNETQRAKEDLAGSTV